MPQHRLRLPDWIITRLAELEAKHGRADLMISDQRAWALAELDARKVPVGVGMLLVYVGDGEIVVVSDSEPDHRVRLDDWTGSR